MASLAIVERIDGELKISRSAGIDDLLMYHPKCATCSLIRNTWSRRNNDGILSTLE